ncbi:chemotaxis protein CheB [Pedobacter sp. P351]|uniref:chemotaxis protein CheB n=1 Tax=Pedobacter superstes TaxID=3133441 RepID=UPI00309AB3A6
MADITFKTNEKPKVLVIGCSAGGFKLVFDLILKLPKDFPLPVIVVIHRSRKHKSSIEELLNNKSKVKVKVACDKDLLKKGTVYFAPSNYHLLVEPDHTLTLDCSEPVLYSRPSIDVTFQSVADVFEDRTIAILLSGANADGASGICYVHEKRGFTIVQNPDDAEVSIMPEAALRKCRPDLILTNKEIFSFMETLAPAIQTKS